MTNRDRRRAFDDPIPLPGGLRCTTPAPSFPSCRSALITAATVDVCTELAVRVSAFKSKKPPSNRHFFKVAFGYISLTYTFAGKPSPLWEYAPLCN
jgi:hypothetical protein